MEGKATQGIFMDPSNQKEEETSQPTVNIESDLNEESKTDDDGANVGV
jgi:hypothetical protein